MPEARELMIMTFMLAYVLLLRLGLSFGSAAMQLLNIWVDPTVKETDAEAELDVDEDTFSTEALERHRRIINHQAYVLPVDSLLTRGSSAESGRSLVWPTGLSSLATLCLQNVNHTSRSIVLNFGSKILTVRLNNHTSVQVYRRETWEASVRDIPALKDARQFKIAIALEFPSFVIAFVTANLTCEPHWYSSTAEMNAREPAPTFPFPNTVPTTREDIEAELAPGPRKHFPLSLQYEHIVAQWIRERRRRSKRLQLAILVIRKHQKIFPGVGVSSVCEIFHIAGLSPYLTEAELFDSPSRTARLIEAFAVFLMKATSIVTPFVQPALHGDTFLAPSLEHRVRCGYGCFYVFAKPRARVTRRVKDLQALYVEDVQNASPVRYDVYEPALMAPAFEKEIHLGELIFGEHFPRTGIKKSAASFGPLHAMFMDAGLIDAPTYLKDDIYAPALPPTLDTRAAHIVHHAFRIETQQRKRSAAFKAKPATNNPKRKRRTERVRNESDPEPSSESMHLTSAATADHTALTDSLTAVPEVRDSAEAAVPEIPKPRYVRGVVWTCVPPHPSDLTRHNLRVFTPAEMKAASFETVVKTTKQVVVGPLEWFGNGVFVRQGRRTIIAACHADPVAFPFNAKANPALQLIRGRERRLYQVQNPGVAKTSTPAPVAAKVRQGINAYNKARAVLANVTDVQMDIPSPSTAVPSTSHVRRRIHADAALVAQAKAAIVPEPDDITEQDSGTANEEEDGEDDMDAGDPYAANPPRTAGADAGGQLFHLHFALPDHPVYESTGRTFALNGLNGDHDEDEEIASIYSSDYECAEDSDFDVEEEEGSAESSDDYSAHFGDLVPRKRLRTQ
ncbi:hypothetical protein EXIGLDRAFT_757181 [Exidia glandulosa HHB12029]|uniref:Uncharacterized protein n=1 Tax=Exidia glandulosa HHB12029 TaxID=1314781 RepID=A0A166NGL8_EXIGL|nr:hypothetical protein EXIGLDRAFT_757181 [Exidia glandulosa HHB12029]